MIRLWLPWYEKRHGDLDGESRQKLETIRPRTLDRMLLVVRRRHEKARQSEIGGRHFRSLSRTMRLP
jgi:hypothetical protein